VSHFAGFPKKRAEQNNAVCSRDATHLFDVHVLGYKILDMIHRDSNQFLRCHWSLLEGGF
jgi:hypothetical protein